MARIGLDLDGVIIDHTEHKIKVAKRLGFAISKKDTPSEVLENMMTKEQYRELQAAIYGPMSLHAKPVAYALPVIKKLVSRGHKLFIISRRHRNSGEALIWLKRKSILDYIPRRRIAFVPKDQDKALWAREFGVDFFMDDQTKVLAYLHSVAHKILFNNHRAKINSAKYEEVHTWHEFFNLVDKKTRNGA